MFFVYTITFSDCDSSVLFYEDNSDTDIDEGAWGPPIPFLGPSLAQRLMGARASVGDWERAPFQRSHTHTQVLDNVFKMGDDLSATTFKRGDLRFSWNDGDDMSAAMLQEPWWPQWQLPVLLSVFALVGGLGLSLVILIWLKNQMSSTSPTGSEKQEMGGALDDPDPVPTASGQPEGGGQWIYHPVIRPMTKEQCENVPVIPLQPQACHAILPEVMTARDSEGEEKRPEPIRIKAKGLLERRGSSASLTIDLLHPSQENLSVTPTRECTAEEYLLSVGNVLSRGQLRSCLKDVRALHREFWDLPLNHPEKLEVPGSGTKNRYRTIIPNEATRVRLPSSNSSDLLSGYINANYIKGYDGEEKAFIATQGPLAHTVADFWLMVWSEQAPVIVMITKLWEKSRSKCEPYFPNDPGTSVTHGEITVTVASVHIKDGYIVRHLDLQKDEETHRVVHFWFDSWPDHKTPANAHSLLCLAKDVEISRFLGPSQRRNSPSTWPQPSQFRRQGAPDTTTMATPGSTDLLSPCPETGQSPPSLKDISPVLSFGHLEFKDDEPEKDKSVCKGESSAKSTERHLISLGQESLESAGEEVFTSVGDIPAEAVNTEVMKLNDISSNPNWCDKNRKARSSGLFDHFPYNTKYGSLPQDSALHSRVELESIRSKSVETPPTWTGQTKDSNSSGDFFDFEKLTISHDVNMKTADENSNQSHVCWTADNEKFIENFDNRLCRGVMSVASPNYLLQTSPTQSCEKSTSKLSVDSPSWAMELSPNLTCSEKSPNQTQSSVESPSFTQSSSSSKKWTHSSDGSKNWTHSSLGSSVWAQSSEDSPLWLEKEEEQPPSAKCIKSPNWFDRSPLFSRRSREGSVSLMWGDLPRGPAAGPVVVHCSAGIGRTGCFIAICIGVSQLLGENNVDILGIVCRMRYDRGGMVQTAEQYEFIHRALALFERSLPDQSGE